VYFVYPNPYSCAYMQVFGDTAQMMAPILVRTIITFSEKRFAAAHSSGAHAQPLIEGIFMAIGLFLLSNIQNCGQQHVCPLPFPSLFPFLQTMPVLMLIDNLNIVLLASDVRRCSCPCSLNLFCLLSRCPSHHFCASSGGIR
jgi:hypothetical protein